MTGAIPTPAEGGQMEASQSTGQKQIQVREVNHYQVTYVHRRDGEPGIWTMQLILDQGAEEHVMQLVADDVDPLQEMMRAATRVWFDMDRKVLMFGTSPPGTAA
jgi:hypothetical protein